MSPVLNQVLIFKEQPLHQSHIREPAGPFLLYLTIDHPVLLVSEKEKVFGVRELFATILGLTPSSVVLHRKKLVPRASQPSLLSRLASCN
ncbi:hypothetical protein SESBI_21981, partial [Sesbania bispinosa]